jgi:hypothetical protein
MQESDIRSATKQLNKAAAPAAPAAPAYNFPDLNAMDWREAAQYEIAFSYKAIGDITGALEIEQSSDKVDEERWGIFSADWNKRVRAFFHSAIGTKDNRKCLHHQVVHRRLHLVISKLFPAWQEIHYTLTRGKPAETKLMDELQRELDGVIGYLQK